MKTRLVAVPLMLLLAACSGDWSGKHEFAASPRQGLVTHVSRTAQDTVYACKASSTGRCHFRVYPGNCTTTRVEGSSQCTGPALVSVEVPAGQSRRGHSLPEDIRICVSARVEGECV
jgi:hypothetical protein